MDAPSASVRALARRLLALEATSDASGAHSHEAVRVCEKLRLSVARFAGADGFTSLLRRSLALARADVPSLKSVTLTPEGCLEEIEQLASDAPNGATEASAAITAHLLGLLVTFIGEPLMLRLVRDAWPEV